MVFLINDEENEESDKGLISSTKKNTGARIKAEEEDEELEEDEEGDDELSKLKKVLMDGIKVDGEGVIKVKIHSKNVKKISNNIRISWSHSFFYIYNYFFYFKF